MCHGNICRSPMAEFVLKDMLEKQGLSANFVVASAATSNEEIWNGTGNPIYPPARRELEAHGILPNNRRAVQVTQADYSEYDYLIVMDNENVRNLKRIVQGDPDEKIWKLMDFAENCSRLKGSSVSDPWYTGNFSKAYSDIKQGCQSLLKKLITQ